MSRSTKILASLALAGAFVLGACQQGQDEGELAEPMTDETGMPEVPDLDEDISPVEVGLEAKAESGITGTATLIPAVDGIEVALDLQGLTAGQTYAAHLHRGSCGEDQGVAAPLEDIAASGTTARSTTMIGESMLDPSAESLFIQVHGADGAPVACGDVPDGAGLTGMAPAGVEAGEYDEAGEAQPSGQGEYQP